MTVTEWLQSSMFLAHVVGFSLIAITYILATRRERWGENPRDFYRRIWRCIVRK